MYESRSLLGRVADGSPAGDHRLSAPIVYDLVGSSVADVGCAFVPHSTRLWRCAPHERWPFVLFNLSGRSQLAVGSHAEPIHSDRASAIVSGSVRYVVCVGVRGYCAVGQCTRELDAWALLDLRSWHGFVGAPFTWEPLRSCMELYGRATKP